MFFLKFRVDLLQKGQKSGLNIVSFFNFSKIQISERDQNLISYSLNEIQQM